MIDTHTHLNDVRFVEDRAAVRERARVAGVVRLIVVGTDPETSRDAVRLAGEFGDGAAVGIHPHDASRATEDALGEIRALASDPHAVAIGETGLDYHYDHSPREVQQEVLRAHLRLACEFRLPVILHCREAYDDLYRILCEEGTRNGVAHCFFGTPEDARRLVDLGLFLGVGGGVTFPKSDELRRTLRETPRERLILETDCPYMAPVPYRGKRNEPAYLPHVVERLADLFEISRAVLEEETTANAIRCFPRLADLGGVGG